MAKINVINTEISVINTNGNDYISLTDMTNARKGESRAADVIKNWIRTRYAIESMSVWEQIHKPNFKVVESDHFKERLIKLNQIAIQQMSVLQNIENRKLLK